MAPADPIARHRVLRRYLLEGERIVTAVHQHWAKVAEPVATTLLGLVVALWLDSVMPPNTGHVADILWWLWILLVLRAAWKLLEWRHDWFVATDKRLILTYGLLTQKVAMMPLSKVTDMSYNRSPLGRVARLRHVRHGERRPGAGAAPRQLGARARPHLPRHLRARSSASTTATGSTHGDEDDDGDDDGRPLRPGAGRVLAGGPAPVVRRRSGPAGQACTSQGPGPTPAGSRLRPVRARAARRPGARSRQPVRPGGTGRSSERAVALPEPRPVAPQQPRRRHRADPDPAAAHRALTSGSGAELPLPRFAL